MKVFAACDCRTNITLSPPYAVPWRSYRSFSFIQMHWKGPENISRNSPRMWLETHTHEYTTPSHPFSRVLLTTIFRHTRSIHSENDLSKAISFSKCRVTSVLQKTRKKRQNWKHIIFVRHLFHVVLVGFEKTNIIPTFKSTQIFSVKIRCTVLNSHAYNNSYFTLK